MMGAKERIVERNRYNPSSVRKAMRRTYMEGKIQKTEKQPGDIVLDEFTLYVVPKNK